MENNLISIVIANYNSEKYISCTLKSILRQSYFNFEILIIDDKSTDNSLNIINKFRINEHRIKLIELTKNSGPAKARNVGIKEAKGEYLTFIDSDDIWDSDFLKTSIEFSKRNDYNFVFSSYCIVNEKLEKKYEDFIVPQRVSFKDMLKSNYISCLTAFINIKQLGKIYMIEEINTHEDYCLWLEYLKRVDFAYGIKRPMASYRIRERSLSRNKFKNAYNHWVFLRNIQKQSLVNSIFYFITYTSNGLRKYKKV
jgi:glycosyltransferase involved in cell wall biosynthesis